MFHFLKRITNISYNELGLNHIRGDTHITSTLRRVGGIRVKWDVVGRRGLASILGVQSLFFITENWICAMTRHYVESNINILLTRNLPFDSDVRQWSHRLMIPLHCLWAKSNNIARGQFERDVTWFCFCFDFVYSHTVQLLFHINVVEIKQVDCKMSTEMWIIINKRHSWYFWTTTHRRV